jgi:tetratricopeptide (TPR) repeat protein
MTRTKNRRSKEQQKKATQAAASTRAPAAARGARAVPSPTSFHPWLAIVAIVALLGAIVAFGGAIPGPFQFDDVAAISKNPTIDRLWPPSVPLSPPLRTAVSGRPVVNYSLAINHAINDALGVEQSTDAIHSHAAAGYRVVNILIHLLSGLLLFGIIRRSLGGGALPQDWSLSADKFAAVITVLWLLHPIQTEAIDYVIQRTELLVSAFYLATLYASIRAWDARRRAGRLGWYAASIAACLLGMASKEVMASAPLAVMLYDRAFRATSWRELFSTGRRWFYAALFATLIPLVAAILGGARSDSVGFHHGITWYQYLYTQAWAISHYIKLVLWPDRLAFDYGQSPIHGLWGLPGAVALAAAGIATLVAWRRAPRLAFLGTCFFMILAPSSSIVPIRTEIAAERRVYLALVPVLILAVLAIEALRRRVAAAEPAGRRRLLAGVLAVIGVAYFASSAWTGRAAGAMLASSSQLHVTVSVLAQLLVAGLAAAAAYTLIAGHDRRWIVTVVVATLVLLSARRSALYADPERLWRDAVAKVPGNPRAYDNLAAAILQKDSSRADEAARALRQAIAIDSTYVTAWSNLADIELKQGKTTEGRDLLEHALRINPDYVDANERLGGVLVKLGDTQRAISYLERATAFHPTDESLGTLAIAYMAAGRREDAKAALRRVIALNPHRVDASSYLGAMLAEEGHPDEAVGYVEAAIRGGDATPATYALLTVTYAQLGRADDAARTASVAAAQPGADAGIDLQLGSAMMMVQRFPDADRFLTSAVALDPRNPEAITRLGLAKAAVGQVQEGVELFRRALGVAPNYEPARGAHAAATHAPKKSRTEDVSGQHRVRPLCATKS